MPQKPTYEKLKNQVRELELAESEYKRKLNALEKEMISYRTIFDAANDAIFIHDAHDGRILDVNLKAQTMYGYTKKEILEMDVASISEGNPPYSQTEAVQHIQRAVKEDGYLFEWRARKKNGDLFWTEVNLKRTILGCEERIIAIARDISDRKQNQQALRESEEQFRQIFDHIDIGIAIYKAVDNGKDFIFKDINPYATRAGKLKREDHIGRHVADIYPGVKVMGLFNVFVDVWRTGRSRYHPMSLYKDGNVTLWVDNYVTKLPLGRNIGRLQGYYV